MPTWYCKDGKSWIKQKGADLADIAPIEEQLPSLYSILKQMPAQMGWEVFLSYLKPPQHLC